MKCAQIQPWLAPLAGGDLGKRESELCRAHVASCADCAQRLQQQQSTLDLLRAAGRTEALPSGFAAALHQRLLQEPPPVPPLSSRFWHFLERLGLDSGPRLGVALGAAALGLLLLTTPVLLKNHPDGATARVAGSDEQVIAASFRVPSQRVAVVHLDFVADVSVEDVEFEVTLPSGLNFVDGGHALAERTLSWRGSLASGSNPIPLAVRGSRPGKYHVTALARGAGVDVKHDILLEVVPS